MKHYASSGERPFPKTGLVRLSSILAPAGPVPVGKSTWWAGVRLGRFPKPVKLGPRTTAWRAEDILGLVELSETTARRGLSRSSQLRAEVKQNETTGGGHDR